MAKVLPFNCIRPAGERAQEIAALPYDVYNRAEAKEEAADKSLSFLHIDRPEINFPDEVDIYDPICYEKAKSLLWDMVDKGYFVQDDGPYFYIYELTMNGHTQRGIVGLCSVEDYENGVIKRHENTRREKEEDRIRHVDVTGAHTGPIFLAYKKNEILSAVIDRVTQGEDLYDFTTEDGVRHRVFIVYRAEDIESIKSVFEKTDSIYIADGHHRCASAVRVGQRRREANPDHNGTEEYNFFLSVLFADEELRIMDYNRLVKTLSGHSEEEVLSLMGKSVHITEIPEAMHPLNPGSFTMYMGGKWYLCAFKDEVKNEDPVEGLDVSLLQKYVLNPVFSIGDPKTDKNIDFVGGIRGLPELERRVNTDMAAAFAMYPTSISSLIAVSDAGLLMPPKSTWFEPKLRSGLFIHKI